MHGAAAGGDRRVGLRAERRQGLRGEDALSRGARGSSPRRCTTQRAPVVICGDLNIARTDMDVHPKERKPRIIGQLPEERALLERIIGHGLVDTGRALEPDNDQMFTWWAPWRNMRQRNIGWRLDYVLASHARSSTRSAAASCSATSARATTRRSWRSSRSASQVRSSVKHSGAAAAPAADSQGSLFELAGRRPKAQASPSAASPFGTSR